MDMRRALLAVAAATVLASVVGVAVSPGAINDPRAPPDRPGTVDIADIGITPGEVRGETVQMRLLVDLRHRGPSTENVTIRHRALDAESGLLVDETTVNVGTLDGDRETRSNGSLTLERAGGYRLETTVYVNGQRRDRQTTRIAGVSALTPAYAESTVGFPDATSWPTVAVSVAETNENSATLTVAVSVTNRGDTSAGGLELRLLLRQAESNVIADETTATVETVRPGRLQTVTARLTVPDGYNYYVDAALFSDDVLIDETQGVANLNPETTIRANETVRSVAFETEDFSNDEAAEDAAVERETGAESSRSSDATPGFGVVLAVLAVLGAAILGRRRQ